MEISEDYIRKRLNQIIETGEFGVSDEVDEAADEVLDYIKSKTKKTVDKIDKYILNAFGSEIKIYFNVINVLDSNEYELLSDNLANWVEPYKWIMITIPFLNGKFQYYDVSDAIQHELEHAFQNIKMGHGFGNQGIYNVSRKYLGTDNLYARCLSFIIYGGTRNEQDAIINGLYRRIKIQRTEEPIDDIVKESNAYVWLKNLYWAKEFLLENENNPEFEPFIEEYKKENRNFNFNRFKLIAINATRDFEWKLARLIKITKKRFMLENHVETYIGKISESITNLKNWMYYLK